MIEIKEVEGGGGYIPEGTLDVPRTTISLQKSPHTANARSCRNGRVQGEISLVLRERVWPERWGRCQTGGTSRKP